MVQREPLLTAVLESEGQKAETAAGTPFYMAPEIYRGEVRVHALFADSQAYDEKCDLFSAGCVLHELCNLTRTFDGIIAPLSLTWPFSLTMDHVRNSHV